MVAFAAKVWTADVRMVEFSSAPEPHPLNGVAQMGAVILVLILQIAVQYRRRSSWRAAAVGVAGLIGLVVLFEIVSPFGVVARATPEWATDPARASLSSASPAGRFRSVQSFGPGLGESDGAWQEGRVPMRIEGLPRGWLATTTLVASEVRLEDGTVVRTAANGYSSGVVPAGTDESPTQIALREVLGVKRVVGALPSGVQYDVPAIVLHESEFKKHAGRKGTYRGEFDLRLEELIVDASFPVRSGAEFRDGRQRLIISRILARDQSAFVRLHQYAASSVFSRQPFSRPTLYLVNRDTSEAIGGWDTGDFEGPGLLGFTLGFVTSSSVSVGGEASGFSIVSRLLRFPGFPTEQPVPALTSDWLGRAELVVVSQRFRGSVRRSIAIEAFEMQAAPAAR
jgi:hypothetical protein